MIDIKQHPKACNQYPKIIFIKHKGNRSVLLWIKYIRMYLKYNRACLSKSNLQKTYWSLFKSNVPQKIGMHEYKYGFLTFLH